jgi:Zn-dependent protease with chaperone function
MYYVLCVCLCAAAVLLVSAACSLLLFAAAPVLRRFLGSCPAPLQAQLTFLLRLLPMTAGLFVTLAIVLPAFLLHEPSHTGERLDLPLMVLASLGMTLILGAGYGAARAWVRLERVRRHWMRSATALTKSSDGVEVFEVADPSALIVVTGILKPRVFLSRPVVSSLTMQEVNAAVAHELAHVSAWDNLKQLLLQATRLPFVDRMTGLDRQWRLASELAADELAIRSGTPVLELASALVKVARLRVMRPQLPEGAVCYFLPPGKESMLSIRVEHLKSILEEKSSVSYAPTSPRIPVLFVAVLAGLASAVLLHPDVLLLTHRLLEKLV